MRDVLEKNCPKNCMAELEIDSFDVNISHFWLSFTNI